MIDDIKIDTSVNRTERTARIEVTLNELLALSEKQTKLYLNELIANTIKTIVMQNYGDIQKLVGDYIHSPGTRAIIEAQVKECLHRVIEENVKDIFGDRK